MIELTDEELNLALRLCVDNLKARMPLTSSFSFGDTKGEWFLFLAVTPERVKDFERVCALISAEHNEDDHVAATLRARIKQLELALATKGEA